MPPLIAAHRGRLVHPHGRHLARALPVEGMVVYDQTAVPPSAEALGVLAGSAPVILPLFSPRSARLAAAAAAGARAPLLPVAISAAAAHAWGAARAEPTRLALRPDAAAMLAAVTAAAAEHSPAAPG